MVFIFPWATVYANASLIAADARWGVFTLIEMFIFAGILILGLAYVWRKGDLEWIRSKPVVPVTAVKIPASIYEKLNVEQTNYKAKPLNTVLETQEVTAATAPVTARKPIFKPTFKKPADE
jgi:NADH-quinone oxidoreductase subunit A